MSLPPSLAQGLDVVFVGTEPGNEPARGLRLPECPSADSKRGQQPVRRPVRAVAFPCGRGLRARRGADPYRRGAQLGFGGGDRLFAGDGERLHRGPRRLVDVVGWGPGRDEVNADRRDLVGADGKVVRR
jgi:hypothetical protein